MRPSKIEYKCYKMLFNKEAWHYSFKKDERIFTVPRNRNSIFLFFMIYLLLYTRSLFKEHGRYSMDTKKAFQDFESCL